MIKKITIDGKVISVKVRDIQHLQQVQKNKSSVTVDKSKVIPRKSKYGKQIHFD